MKLEGLAGSHLHSEPGGRDPDFRGNLSKMVRSHNGELLGVCFKSQFCICGDVTDTRGGAAPAPAQTNLTFYRQELRPVVSQCTQHVI